MFKKLSSKTDKSKFWKEARKNKKKNTLPTQDHRYDLQWPTSQKHTSKNGEVLHF